MSWRSDDEYALLTAFLAWLDYQDDREQVEDETLALRFLDQRQAARRLPA